MTVCVSCMWNDDDDDDERKEEGETRCRHVAYSSVDEHQGDRQT